MDILAQVIGVMQDEFVRISRVSNFIALWEGRI